jgi:ATP-dependent DNA helicase RecG
VDATDLRLLERLLDQGECDWVEFKESWYDPQPIGRYASALANGARVEGKPYGYLVWGVSDTDHSLAGTTLNLASKKVAQQPFEFWLKGRLSPKGHHLRVLEFRFEGRRVIILEFGAAQTVPVRFEGIPYIRVGSATPKLEDHPDRERRLLEALVETSFDSEWAQENVTADEVFELLNVGETLALLNQPKAPSSPAQLEQLQKLRLIEQTSGNFWAIRNVAAVLFARRLADFGSRFERRAPRVIFYEGDNRVTTRYEQTGARGYALGFRGLFVWLENRLPRSEHLKGVLREDRPLYPIIALRELAANALIHQDFSARGSGPMIELFEDRAEISNPGQPLIGLDRLMDEPPRSRNEQLASLMRKIGYCEERGSGIDKVVYTAEAYQLPPPAFESKSNGFVASIFAPRSFTEMTSEERTRACYWHACLLWVSGTKAMTNSTLRARLGLPASRVSAVSRVIGDALDAQVIRDADPSNRSRAQASYVPYWA